MRDGVGDATVRSRGHRFRRAAATCDRARHTLHGASWNGLRHGYHRFLFDGATLGRCLERAGFDVLRRPRRDMPFDDILILWGRKAARRDIARSRRHATATARSPEHVTAP